MVIVSSKVTKLRVKPLLYALTIILIGIICLTPLASAVAPNPTYASATVDGQIDEWNLLADFFADMHRAGDPSKPVESKLYIRYDAIKEIVYVLVLAEPHIPVCSEKAEEAWVKIDGQKGNIVDDTFGDDDPDNPPDFAWVPADRKDKIGYEASFKLPPGSYKITVHVNVFDDKEVQTSLSLSTLQMFAVPDSSVFLAIASMAGATGLFTVYKRRNKH